MPAPSPGDYTPTPEDQELIKFVNDRCSKWRMDRQTHERQWFINAAFFRGQQYVEWSAREQRLSVPPAPSHRIRLVINRIFPKVRARLAKFLKNRPKPVVVAATQDQNDKMNARATEQALEFQWRKLRLETKFKQALLWAKDCGKGFWVFYWDPSKTGRVQQIDPMTGQKRVQDAQLGDICVEVASPFEILVEDPSCPYIGEQPAIMRIRMMPVSDIATRYPEMAPFIEGNGGNAEKEEYFRFEDQIATLNTQGYGGSTNLVEERRKEQAAHRKLVLVKEYFERPSSAYPEGRYVVVGGDVLLRNEAALPYGFHDLDNPYPIVQFSDVEVSGQFWGPTVIEQLIGLQREYNLLRSKIAEQTRMMAFPKLLAAKQHQIPRGAWTSEAGEFIEYVALPGVPPPTPWHPPNIANDIWRSLELIQKEFEDITHIFPASEGRTGAATSGFQTNLLQEATDTTHAPDVRAHEIAIEEAAFKIRRLMKLGYDIPRLISITGRNYEPEVREFSADAIDEHADIIIQAGSALPDLKYARMQSIMEMFEKGLLGDPLDPEVKRKALSMLEMGGLEQAFDPARRDEDQARVENAKFAEQQAVPLPEFFQNHNIHYQIHTDLLKSPEGTSLSPEMRLAATAHVIKHVEFINPLSAAQLAREYGLIGLGLLKPETEMLLLAPPMVGGPGAAEGGSGEQPSQGPPQ
jgi:hypothetical protein